jgi:hypothetical protein
VFHICRQCLESVASVVCRWCAGLELFSGTSPRSLGGVQQRPTEILTPLVIGLAPLFFFFFSFILHIDSWQQRFAVVLDSSMITAGGLQE